MKTSAVNNQNLNNGVPYSTVEALLYIYVYWFRKVQYHFQSELGPPTV